jgi:hypothetical protein
MRVVRERIKQRRLDSVDTDVPKHGSGKKDRVDLGMALLEIFRRPGATFTRQDIAVWCGCTDAAIFMLERRVLRKVRNKFRFGCERSMSHEMGKYIPPAKRP